MDTVLESARSIRVLHEGATADPALARAHTLLRESEIVCFLGFGYHPANLQRLRLERLNSACRVFCSSYQFFRGQRQSIAHFFHHFGKLAQWGHPREDCLQFLKSAPVLVGRAREFSSLAS